MVCLFTLSNFKISRRYLALTKSLTNGAVVTCVLAVVGLVSSPAKAAVLTNSAQLSDLIGTGNEFQVGDKLFSNFFYTSTGGATPDFKNVGVAGKDTPGDPSIVFGGQFQGPSTGEISFGFDVTELNPANSITGASLSVSGNQPSSAFSDIETIFANSLSGAKIGTLYTSATSPTASVSFAPQQRVSITEDIEGMSPGFHFSTDAKSFHQDPTPAAVPEPSSVLGTLALGAFATGSLLKHKQKKPNCS